MDSKSTYQSLIDDVRAEINENALAEKSDESFQVDILNAEQKIADDYDIAEEYNLRLTANVDEYFFQDRPPITDASNASPIAVRTRTPHGLSNNDIIFIRGVQGNTAANGSFVASVTDSYSFTLKKFARLIGANVKVAPVEITTEGPHGLTSGTTVTLSGDWLSGIFVATITAVDKFTIPIGVSNEFTGTNNIATWNSVGDGAYIAGGRFWKENEIPTHIGRIIFGEVNFNKFCTRIDVVGEGEIVDAETWSNWFTSAFPTQMAQSRKDGKRYLRLSIPPTESKTLRLYGILKITPSLYYDDPLNAQIHLDSEWDEGIKRYMMSKAYKFLKDRQSATEEMNGFFEFMRSKKLNTVKPRYVRMVYG
jgi:hypothetical protein